MESKPRIHRCGKETVNNIKVVNDIAQRVIKLFQDYNKPIKNEEDKQISKRISNEMVNKAIVEIMRPSNSKDQLFCIRMYHCL